MHLGDVPASCHINLFKQLCHVQREQLTEVIVRLLQAWGEPLSELYQSMSQDQNQDFNLFSSNKALEISGILHELKDGVTIITEKVTNHFWL